MTRSRAARLVAAVAVVAAVVAGIGFVPVAGAAAGVSTPAVVRAAEPPEQLPVTLRSMTPAVPTSADTLVISGTVTNTAASTARGVVVRLRLSPTPVRSRAEIVAILGGSAGRTGVTVEGTRKAVADTLAAGAKASFTISVAVTSLRLSSRSAEVVVLGVESLADLDNDGQGVVQTGFTRTFLPWFPVSGQVAPTPVVWLFPLSTAPSRAGDGVFLDDHLATEVAARGRLTRLLDAAEGAPSAVSWVVDPALLQSLQDMTDGYVVRRPDGSTTPGTGEADATTFLTRLSALTASAEVTASAYADPDVVALHRAGLDVDIALASTTARDLPQQLLRAPVGHGLAWPAGQVSDDGTLDVLRASGSRVVVLTAASFPPSPAVAYTPSGSVDLATGGAPLRAALSDPVVSSLVAAPTRTVAGPPGTADPVVRRQTALAEIAMTSLELPATPRTMVIAPDLRWASYGAATHDLVLAVAASPFATPSRLGTLVATPASEVPRARADYPAAARSAELRPAYLAGVAAGRADLAGLRSVAPDTTGQSTDELEAGLTRTESSAWRSDAVGGRRLLTSVRGEIDTEVARVRVLSRAPVTLPGDSGTIPVTVANDLDRPARVGLRLTGTPATRFEAADLPAVTLAPGEKSTLEVSARVLGTGPVSVDITLLTPEGEVYGEPTTTEVRSAAYARAAQWVVGGLFGILVLLLGVNFVRRRRPGAESGEPAVARAGPTHGGTETEGDRG
jgi:hypothetical protein